jgi:hypothetical protein
MATAEEQKVEERRVRRMAERQGLTLTKSRRRDELASDYGLFWVKREGVVISPDHGVELAEAEAFLRIDPDER